MTRYVLTPNFRVPITTTQDIEVKGNAITMQNAGDSTILINDKWTLRPSGSLSFGSSDNVDIVIAERMSVVFTGGNTNRLEIIETQTTTCA